MSEGIQLTSEVNATLKERQRRGIQPGEGQQVQKGLKENRERTDEPANAPGGGPDSLPFGKHTPTARSPSAGAVAPGCLLCHL